jgi:hypothetical protein
MRRGGHNRGMSEKIDRFPLLRFIAWFGGLLAVATGLALLMARAEAEALTDPAPAADVSKADTAR